MRNLFHRFIGDAVVMYEPYDLIQRGRQRALTSLGSRRRQPPRAQPPQNPAERAKLQGEIAKAERHGFIVAKCRSTARTIERNSW